MLESTLGASTNHNSASGVSAVGSPAGMPIAKPPKRSKRGGHNRKLGPRERNGRLRRGSKPKSRGLMIRTEAAYPPERAQHDAVVLASANQTAAITDTYGLRSDPYLVVDLLSRLQRRGLISPEGRQAAERFRDDFALAYLDKLHAPDLSAPVVSGRGGPDPDAGRKARDRIFDGIAKLGGPTSEKASCAWDVLGGTILPTLGDPLIVWATLRRWRGLPLSAMPEQILVATIAALADIGYGERRGAI